MEYFKATLVKE